MLHKFPFKFPKECGLQIPIFITDRHKGIAKWTSISEKTQHFNDLRHVLKGLSKKILKAKKNVSCWHSGQKVSAPICIGALCLRRWDIGI